MKRLTIYLAVTIAGFVVALVAATYLVPTTFIVVATSEVVRFQTAGAPTSRWPLSGAELLEGDSAGNFTRTAFTGSIEIGDSVEVVLQRVSGGPVILKIDPVGANRYTVEFYDESDELIRRSLGPVEIRIDSLNARASRGESIVLPLVGDIEVGAAAGFQTGGAAPMLRSGTVTMVGSSFLSKSLYKAGDEELRAGDVFQVIKPLSNSYATVIVDERPALNLVSRASSFEAEISRAGTSSTGVSTPLRARILSDKSLQSLWLTFALVWGTVMKLWKQLSSRRGSPT